MCEKCQELRQNPQGYVHNLIFNWLEKINKSELELEGEKKKDKSQGGK